MATLRMQEMHTYWGTEWESFRIVRFHDQPWTHSNADHAQFARHIDFERSAAVRTILIEYSHASIMAREGALKVGDKIVILDIRS